MTIKYDPHFMKEFSKENVLGHKTNRNHKIEQICIRMHPKINICKSDFAFSVLFVTKEI